MPVDEAMLASVRQANALYHAGYERRLAAEIVAMIRNTGVDARLVLAFVHAMMNVTLPPRQPPPDEPPRPDAA